MSANLTTWNRLRIMVPERDAVEIEQLLDELGGYFDLEHRSLGHLGTYRCVRYKGPIIENYEEGPNSSPSDEQAPACVCIETWCSPGIEEAVIRAIQAKHPYEHPVIEVSQVQLAEPSHVGKPKQQGRINPERTKALVLPSNQKLTSKRKWPVVGEKEPRKSDAPWEITVKGEVENPKTWSLEALKNMTQVEQMVNIHCVTRWSRPHSLFQGIHLKTLLDICKPKKDARFVSFIARSERNHDTSLPLETSLSLNTLIAFSCDGKPLEQENGGPIRIVVPGRYFYKSLKWLETIELLNEDRLGYWESPELGYHNNADPWLEQRYIISGREIPKKLLADLAKRDISNQDFLSLSASLMNLENLNAEGAVLRNVDFKKAKLMGAKFQKANLSNGHFEGADLRGASFRDADAEGADFCGADLRGVDFLGASLFGATFCPDPGDQDQWPPAIVDETTKISLAQVERLAQSQQEFLLPFCYD